jgi:YVTN family beta-propeller protein
MNKWWTAVKKAFAKPKRLRRQQQWARLNVEELEVRSLLDAAPAQHVLLLSVDGLHQADVTDPNLAPDLTNILKLQDAGVSYSNASTSKPSDSFPGALSYLTGAGPGTTGVFYDDSYSRTLFAPGSNVATATPGTEVAYAENLDKNQALLSGGGNFDATSIDPAQLPLNSQGQPVYPNQFLQVNTIFDVAHQAGLYTAFADKHPAYQIANGNDPNAINDFYGPEINSTTALYDPVAMKTVDANALLAANPFTDVSKYILVDASTDPMGPNDPNLINDTTHNLLLTEKYDDLKVQAILNEIAGQASHSSPDITNPQVPALFGMNFQAVSVAQKYALGGIVLLPDGSTAPSQVLEAAIQHTDASIGKIVAALQNTTDLQTGGSLWNTTEVVLTAKHGQTPRVNPGGLMADSTIPNLLNNAGATVAQATQDDVSLIWLQDQSRTQAGVQALQNFVKTGTLDVYFQGTKVTLQASQVIDKILSGSALVNAGFGNPATDSTTPDIIVTLKPGYIWVGNPLKFTFKRAEHGGFSDTDTHVALIVSGGVLSPKVRGKTVDAPVQTTQIAVTALNSLGLNAAQLQGAVIEATKGLPGLGIPQDTSVQLTEGESAKVLVGAFYDSSTSDNLTQYKASIKWGDNTGNDKNVSLVRDATNAHIVDVYGVHTYEEEGTYNGTVKIVSPANQTTNLTFTATVLDVLTAEGKTLDVNANEPFDLATVATFSDPDADANKGDFSARIFWGDGYQSNGVVVNGGKGNFTVEGSHTYVGHADATYAIKVVITDDLGSTVEADGKANVTFAPPPPTSSGTAPAPNPPGTPAGPQGDGTSITPQGWFVSPAGTQTQLGDRPFGIALSPDGKFLAITNDGAGTQSVMVVDRAQNKVISEIDYTADGQGVYVGIAYSPDGSKLYASAGGTVYKLNGVSYNGVRVYDVDPATGQLTETDPLLIPLPIGTNGRPINLFLAGLALSADGNSLYVAGNLGSALSVIDLTSAAATTGGAATTLQVGPNPYTVALSHDGKTAYVSNQGGLTVSVVDLTQPFLAETDRIEVGTHPNALALNPKNDELYVANADSDTISVIDTRTNVVIRTIDLSPYPGSEEGSSPDALTVAPDGKTLYVANALNNDVAVIQLGGKQGDDKVLGLIPTAWYPTALLLSNHGKELDVLNAKGLGAGPNVNGPNPYTNPYSPIDQYIASMIKGSLSQIVVPDATQLASYTQQVVAHNGFNEGDKVRTAGTPPSSVIPLRPGDPTPIQHVIYVIKENRTYDQEFGSLGKGNGDPSLNLFGDESAPNARALEKEFVTLDNFYSDAEVSADGWNWSVGAEANSYVQHAWPEDYGNFFASRPYDFEGGNLATSPDTDPTDAFIWNKLSDAGISYRNYGFRVFGGQVAGNPSTEPRLAANTDLAFAGYDLRKPDSIPDLIKTGVNQPTRIGEWLKEFNTYETNGTLPTVEFVRLPNDHTATNTIGAPTPRAYVADNDYALGQLVDAVSHSKDWGSTAIFVIEDDAQEGPDHVDAHRTVAQVISPYTQTGNVDSTFYSQVSVLRTIEQIVGIGPMTQFDAAATPLLNAFTNTPNMKPYTAIVPTQDVHEKNPVNPPMAAVAAKSLDQVATLVDQNETLENQVLWAYYGTGPMPAPRTSFHDLSVPGSEDTGTVDDAGVDISGVPLQGDTTDQSVQADPTNSLNFSSSGATVTNTSTTTSSSFSGTLSNLTGSTGASSDPSSSALSTVELAGLANDNTAVNSVGASTPQADGANNDTILGQLLDAMSHARDGGNLQGSPAHAEGHQTIAQGISSGTQTDKAGSTFSSQVFLRTIEPSEGIDFLTSFDAAAMPLLNAFSNKQI